MKKKLFIGLILGLFVSCMAGIASADIINLDAEVDTISSPDTLFLGDGTYNVEVIGTDEGGVYNAWNPWGFTSGCSENDDGCTTGWINSYHYGSVEIGTVHYGDGNKYANEILALQNAVDSSFTLSYAQTVNFWIADSYYRDNIEGISLNITEITNPGGEPIPEPATMLLFGVGLAGLAGYKRRQAKKK